MLDDALLLTSRRLYLNDPSKTHLDLLRAVADTARRDALEDAAQLAESGLFDGDDPRSSDEAAYNTARREAAEAIRALIDAPHTPGPDGLRWARESGHTHGPGTGPGRWAACRACYYNLPNPVEEQP